jgi:hypothetical protein
MKTRDFYEVRLYLGCTNNKTGRRIYSFTIERLIGEAQKKYEIIIPVRLTLTRYISGPEYSEDGWEIAAFNYPKITVSKTEIKEFMLKLGNKLLKKCGQNRICITDSLNNEIIMLEGDKDG